MAARVIAITGATGFLGSHVLKSLVARGLRPRILARRNPALPPELQAHVDIIQGDLASSVALAKLVDQSSAILHMAGLTKALSRNTFMEVNRDGTERLAQAVKDHAPEAHFILVSSLAAREPHLSFYAASKRAGEDAAKRILKGRALTIFRPPAIYGPGDREFLPIFKLASLPLVPLLGQPANRVALSYVRDVAKITATLAASPPDSQTETNLYSCGGALPEGHSWHEILQMAAQAQGRSPRFIQLPSWPARHILMGAGRCSELLGYLTGKPKVFTAGKAREMLHPDWGIRPEDTLPEDLALSFTPLKKGFETTTAWYRQEGWLP